MIIVRFIGGLGNQMFQYAFYKYLKENYKNVKADISDYKYYKLHNGYELERIFGIKLDIASERELKKCKDYSFSHRCYLSKIRRKIIGKKPNHIMEDEYSNTKLKKFDNIYLSGYWQGQKYLKKNDDNIKTDFKFDGTNKLKKLLEKIKSTNSVSIHFRRGDYVNNKRTNAVHGVCKLDYYYNSIKFINKNVSNPIYYILSDDIDWVKQNFKLDCHTVYIDKNRDSEYYLDMYLMSLCKHNIIANSSFSWWGAWLNKNPNKIVIAPQKWFADTVKNKRTNKIIPKEWIRI